MGDSYYALFFKLFLQIDSDLRKKRKLFIMFKCVRYGMGKKGPENTHCMK